jgi:hypothetical protein
MPTLEANFDVYCGVCGYGICNDTEVSNSTKYQSASIKVTCSYCEKKIKDLEKENELLEKTVEILNKKEV